MKIEQREISLGPHRRGIHIVTREIEEAVPELREIERGVAHVHILHTSASLALNENADPDVRTDLASILDHLVPENEPYYVHTIEGPDDMPAHAKSVLTGASVTVPVRSGRFRLGTWQGIYLLEHRKGRQRRNVIVTVFGE
jgi:secondary thiamine-phosphate synthase enzyme